MGEQRVPLPYARLKGNVVDTVTRRIAA